MSVAPVTDPETAIWVLIGMVLMLTIVSGLLTLRIVQLEFQLLREQLHRNFDRADSRR